MSLLTPDETLRQTRELWRTCFSDSEAFMDLYFSRKYTAESNVFITRGDQVVAALQAFVYPMNFYGTVVRAGYLSGVAVHPDHRGKGLASRLIDEANHRLHRAGAVMSWVIPAEEGLYDFYERHGGYQTAAYRMDVRPDDETEPPAADCIVEEPDDEAGEIYVCYRDIRRRTDLALCHSRESFYTALADWRLGGHLFCTVRRRSRLTGMCFARKDKDGTARIYEILARDDQSLDALVHHVRQTYADAPLYAKLSVGGNTIGAEPYAMARVLDAQRFLRAVLHANPTLTVDVGVGADRVLPDNNAYYHLADGRLSLTDMRPATLTTSGGLARMFLAAQAVQLKLMMDD